MNDEDYNFKLCEERHEDIKEAFKKMDSRMHKVENRFLIILTALIVNLLGVVSSLVILLFKMASP